MDQVECEPYAQELISKKSSVEWTIFRTISKDSPVSEWVTNILRAYCTNFVGLSLHAVYTVVSRESAHGRLNWNYEFSEGGRICEHWFKEG